MILLSTHHHKKATNRTNKKKPHIVEFYNKNKGGVDTVDSIISHYRSARRTRRWTMKFFMYLVDIAMVNSTSLMMLKNKNSHQNSRRRDLVEQLGIELVTPHIQERFLEIS